MNTSQINPISSFELDPIYDRRSLLGMNRLQVLQKEREIIAYMRTKFSSIVFLEVKDYNEFKHVYKSILLLQDIHKIKRYHEGQIHRNLYSKINFSTCFIIVALFQLVVLSSTAAGVYSGAGEGTPANDWRNRNVISSIALGIISFFSAYFVDFRIRANFDHSREEDSFSRAYSGPNLKRFYKLLSRVSDFDDLQPAAKENLIAQIIQSNISLSDYEIGQNPLRYKLEKMLEELCQKYGLKDVKNLALQIPKPLLNDTPSLLPYLPLNFLPYKSLAIQQTELRRFINTSLQMGNSQWSLIAENVKRLMHIRSYMFEETYFARIFTQNAFQLSLVLSIAPTAEAIYESVAPDILDSNNAYFITCLSNIAKVVFGVSGAFACQAAFAWLSAYKFDKNTTGIEDKIFLTFSKQMNKLTRTGWLTPEGQKKALFKAKMAYEMLAPEIKAMVPISTIPLNIVDENMDLINSDLIKTFSSPQISQDNLSFKNSLFQRENLMTITSAELNLNRKKINNEINEILKQWKEAFDEKGENISGLPKSQIKKLYGLLKILEISQFVLETRQNDSKRNILSFIKENGFSITCFTSNLLFQYLGQSEGLKAISETVYRTPYNGQIDLKDQDMTNTQYQINNIEKTLYIVGTIAILHLMGLCLYPINGKKESFIFESSDFRHFINLLQMMCDTENLSQEGQQKAIEHILSAFDELPKSIKDKLPFGRDIELVLKKIMKSEEMV